MKKLLILGASMVALAACDTTVPDSGSGVGFSDYTQYELERARREAALSGDPMPANTAVVPPSSTGISPAELEAGGIATGDAAGDTPAAQPANLASNPGISDEQDFDAVAGRETIQSDAERRQQQAAAYQLIEPTAVPNRPVSTGPNIVEYALSAPNDLGETIYSRSAVSGAARFQRNCAKYNSPDAAQRDFLARGGPERDRLGIDPDGDGFACGWDPSAFRVLATGN